MVRHVERSIPYPKEKLSKQNVLITVDGSTTAGKRVIAEKLADRYDLNFLNTGTTIRSLALLAIENNLVKTDDTNVRTIPVDFADRIVQLFDTMPDPIRIEKPLEGSREVRTMVGDRDMHNEVRDHPKQKAIENLSSIIAAAPAIRWRLYQLWRNSVNALGRGTVIIGRKTGMDLFPEAPIKLYFFSSPQASATYRVLHDPTQSLRQSTEELYVRERDGQDRENGLLDRPNGAIVVDTSEFILRGDNGLSLLEQKIAQNIEEQYEFT